jgi:hypothetical protein
MDAADKWVEVVRDMKDAAPEPYEVEVVCRDILRYMRTMRIRDIGRFKQRIGLEYEAFIKSLPYEEERIDSIVKDDEFWDATVDMIRR